MLMFLYIYSFIFYAYRKVRQQIIKASDPLAALTQLEHRNPLVTIEKPTTTTATTTTTTSMYTEDSEECQKYVSQYLFPPTLRTVHAMLSFLRDRKEYGYAISILKEMHLRAASYTTTPPPSPATSSTSTTATSTSTAVSKSTTITAAASTTSSTKTTPSNTPLSSNIPTPIPIVAANTVIPVTLTKSGNSLINQQLSPNIDTYSIVIETCVVSKQYDLALDILAMMERETNYTPNRRIYSNLIQAFGQNSDLPSALGVFHELKTKMVPDIGNTITGILHNNCHVYIPYILHVNYLIYIV